MKPTEAEVLDNLTTWILSANKYVHEHLDSINDIRTKSGEYDLVTSIDYEVEKMLDQQITKTYPEAVIIGEEKPEKDYSAINSGLVFFVDPIDGTLNLVKKHDCFAIMIGAYYDGKPLCAGIMDVMNNELYWGGLKTGVYCNQVKLHPAVDQPLKEGLVGVSWRQFLRNSFEEIRIAKNSAGIRVMGSAGLEFVEVITGKHIAYLATLNPWDIAAGNVLVQALGYRISNVSGNDVNLQKVNHIMVANQQTYRDIRKIQTY
ncbi:inositol monophosphatase family protein [Companilactobacillus furfuricola]|uniref:inositol monophosphatase family protein n=1 Tax=Companilactobacillus furfuricola TaxID=1462575 RepID=UPI000F799793|nr:inositol monophosphatase family protein [Companilactobacillus furfuricola]